MSRQLGAVDKVDLVRGLAAARSGSPQKMMAGAGMKGVRTGKAKTALGVLNQERGEGVVLSDAARSW